MPFIKRVTYGALLLFSLSCLILSPHAAALGTSDFKVYPTTFNASDIRTKAWFIEKLGQGQTTASSVSITSTAKTNITLLIYAVDATANNGVFTLLGQNDPKMGVGAWIKLAKNSIVLNPGQTMVVPFMVQIPQNASVGDHDGGIVVQEATGQPRTLTNGTTINIVSRVGIRMYETVPGTENPALQVTHFSVTAGSHKNNTFQISMKNTGNIDLQPTSNITITGLTNHGQKIIPLKTMGSMLPNTTETSQATVTPTSIWPSWHHAQLIIQYANHKQVSQTISYITYKPYTALIPLIVILVLIGAVQLKKRFTIQRRIK